MLNYTAVIFKKNLLLAYGNMKIVSIVLGIPY